MQNDDYGKDYFNGFKQGLGKDADKIVAARHLRGDRSDGRQPDDPAQELRRQRVLQHHDAQVRGPGHQEGGRDRLEAGALPQQRVGLGRHRHEAGRLRELPGHHHGALPQGPHRQAVGRTPRISWSGRPSWASTMPNGNLSDGSHVYGYAVANLMAIVLKQCGDDLTRANVMKQAANLKDVELPMLLPGIKVNTSPTDFYPIQSVQLARFKGETLGAVRRDPVERERRASSADATICGRRASRRPQLHGRKTDDAGDSPVRAHQVEAGLRAGGGGDRAQDPGRPPQARRSRRHRIRARQAVRRQPLDRARGHPPARAVGPRRRASRAAACRWPCRTTTASPPA